MPEEVGTETTRTDGPGADDSPSGDAADETPAATAGEQDSKEETSQEQQGPSGAGEQDAGGENTPEAQGDNDDGDKATPAEVLKVVVSIKGGQGHHRRAAAIVRPAHRDLRTTMTCLRWRGEVPAVIGEGEGQVGRGPEASCLREARSTGQDAGTGGRRAPRRTQPTGRRLNRRNSRR